MSEDRPAVFVIDDDPSMRTDQGPRVADRPLSDPTFRRVVEAALEHERRRSSVPASLRVRRMRRSN